MWEMVNGGSVVPALDLNPLFLSVITEFLSSSHMTAAFFLSIWAGSAYALGLDREAL